MGEANMRAIHFEHLEDGPTWTSIHLWRRMTSTISGCLGGVAVLLLIVHIILGTAHGDGDDGTNGVIGLVFLLSTCLACVIGCAPNVYEALPRYLRTRIC